MKDRMERVGETMRREISIILQGEINDPRVRDVTVTRVKVARDLRSAKVFCVISAGEAEKQNIMKGLKNASGFIRSKLSERISVKFSPRILFREDLTAEKKEQMNSIFRRIEEEHRGKRGETGEDA
ncbi:MAG: 30S ribosome-binding factor RbfA [Candidatus Makaraimicrobium thalassicum]|nr:MAG: 30S ribosome-binding factor RbfA [Candidatus Omnitrophota bacterium]